MDSEPSLKGCNSSPKDKYGERFLHSVFDEISTTDPDRLYASIPIAMDVAQGFTDLTFKDIAHCVDTLACSLDKEIGCSSQEETLAYLGLPDLRNVIVFLAVVKCGYKVGQLECAASASLMPAVTLPVPEKPAVDKQILARTNALSQSHPCQRDDPALQGFA